MELARHPVVVLYGGRSTEREVSLKSGTAVAHAISEAGEGRPSHVYRAQLETDGCWLFDGKRLSPAEALARLSPGALFFLALHGGEGEDGRVQGFLESMGFGYTGSGVAGSALCMNKSHTKAVVATEGVRVPRGTLVRALDWQRDPAACLSRLAAFTADGAVVKPNCGGSSVATFVLDGGAELAPKIEAALATGDDALVEERIRGTECTVGVLGNARGELTALTPVEIEPKQGRFFDYEEKYSAQGAREHCPPLHIPEPLWPVLKDLAMRAHRAAGCEGYSRIDFLVPTEGAPVMLEINTLPGMTERSLLPQAAAVHGLNYRQLCLEILLRALARKAS
jgi:D-alanine-D-alanine ligase